MLYCAVFLLTPFACRYLEKAGQCKAKTTFNTTLDLLWSAISFRRNASAAGAPSMQRYLVTGTLGEAGVLGQLAKTPISGRARAAVVFNASLAIQHDGIDMQESFDAVILLVSDPRISIEALSRLPRSKLAQMLPQPFAPANQTALRRAMVH